MNVRPLSCLSTSLQEFSWPATQPGNISAGVVQGLRKPPDPRLNEKYSGVHSIRGNANDFIGHVLPACYACSVLSQFALNCSGLLIWGMDSTDCLTVREPARIPLSCVVSSFSLFDSFRFRSTSHWLNAQCSRHVYSRRTMARPMTVERTSRAELSSISETLELVNPRAPWTRSAA